MSSHPQGKLTSQMVRRWLLFTAALLTCGPWCAAQAQSGAGTIANRPRVRVTAHVAAPPKTAAAKAASLLLDEVVDPGVLNVAVGELDQYLQSELGGIGVFVDARALQVAKVDPAKRIQAELPAMPLRAVLRKVLSPLGLKATIEDEGLAITADFVELTRRGIATDKWLEENTETDAAIRTALDRSVRVAADKEPLADVIASLARTAEIPMILDRRALEEVGLSADQPVTFQLQDVSLRSALRLVLRELDLTYHIRNEVLEITTIEAAEQNLIKRIYFLEGLGLAGGDPNPMVMLIVGTVVPDAWEQLGGPSTILAGPGKRPSLVVSTTSDLHEKIADMLQQMREAELGRDPAVASP